MSRWTFDDPTTVMRLGGVLEAWSGTPFFPRTAQRGVGVDCIRFAIAVLQDLEIVGAIEWPRYPIKGGGADLLTLIDGRLQAETCLCCIWRRGDSSCAALAPMPGDVWLADNPIHLAISGDRTDEVWHCLHPRGVQHGVLSTALRERVLAVYRAEASRDILEVRP